MAVIGLGLQEHAVAGSGGVDERLRQRRRHVVVEMVERHDHVHVLEPGLILLDRPRHLREHVPAIVEPPARRCRHPPRVPQRQLEVRVHDDADLRRGTELQRRSDGKPVPLLAVEEHLGPDLIRRTHRSGNGHRDDIQLRALDLGKHAGREADEQARLILLRDVIQIVHTLLERRIVGKRRGLMPGRERGLHRPELLLDDADRLRDPPGADVSEVGTDAPAEADLVAVLDAEEAVREALGEGEVLELAGRVVVVRDGQARDILLQLAVAHLQEEPADHRELGWEDAARQRDAGVELEERPRFGLVARQPEHDVGLERALPILLGAEERQRGPEAAVQRGQRPGLLGQQLPFEVRDDLGARRGRQGRHEQERERGAMGGVHGYWP